MLGRVLFSLLLALGAGLLGTADAAGAAAPLADVMFIVGLALFLLCLFLGPKLPSLRRSAVRVPDGGDRRHRRQTIRSGRGGSR
jgi:uncharacterized membrane protein YtjA (UPF0391 family)